MNPEPLRNPLDFYRKVETASPINKRLKIFLSEYQDHRRNLGRPLHVLDVGCGRDPTLYRYMHEDDDYVGCDLADPISPSEGLRFEVVDLNNDSLLERFHKEKFDVIFCGEIIEHLFSPDALVKELRALLADDGVLILSTPNLGYWVNRLLLLVGISPLFLENSSQKKLGRRFRFLGQGHSTEGHIRLFTYRALLEFVVENGFEPVKVRASPVWPNVVDELVSRFIPSLAPDLILVLKKNPAL